MPAGTWYDAKGTKYTKLPQNLNYSILLSKGRKPDVSSSIKAEKTKTVYGLGEKVTLEDLTVTYYGKDGSVRKLDSAEYRTNIDTIDTTQSKTTALVVTYEQNGVILTDRIELTIASALETSGLIVTLPEMDYVYDGRQKTPVPIVSFLLGEEEKILQIGRDYTLSYRNNVNAYEGSLEEGMAKNAPTVFINGRGEYSGTVAQVFPIKKAKAPVREKTVIYAPECGEEMTWRTYDMSGSFASYGKKTNYKVEAVTESDEYVDNVLSCKPFVNTKGILAYSTNVGTGGNSVIITIKVSFENYQDSLLDVKLIQKYEKPLTISGITMNDRVYNGSPISYSGKLFIETDEDGSVAVDETERYGCWYSYRGIQADGTPYGADEDAIDKDENEKESSVAPVNAGKYIMTITVRDIGYGKYVGMKEYPFEILPAPITITAQDITLVKGESLPASYDYKVTGLVNQDALIKEPVFTYNVDKESIDLETPGVYEIIPDNADAGMNYEIREYRRGRLVIAEEKVAYTVSFDLSGHEGGNNQIPSMSVKAGSLITRPEIPIAKGYTFAGWYKDQTFAAAKAWNFDTDIVQSDIVLYACWLVNAAKEKESGLQLCIQDIPMQTYTGSALKPNVTVYDGDGKTLLKAGKDYTIKYAQNTEAVLTNKSGKLPDIGTAVVTNAGKKDETTQNVTGSFSKKYPYVIITGKGNYSETIYKNFYICPADIAVKDENGDSVLAPGFTLKYSGQMIKDTKKVQTALNSFKYKKAMKPGIDYTVTLKANGNVECDASVASGENIQPQEWVGMTEYNSKNKKYNIPTIPKGYYGTFTMTVAGIGNYTGEVVKSIYVTESASGLIKNATIKLGKNQKSINYQEGGVQLKAGYYDADGKKYYALDNGKDVEKENGNDIFTVSVKNGKTVTYLKYDSRKESDGDYFITYQNNDRAGTATMTITGNPAKGYFGSKSVTFKITGMAFSAKTIEVKTYDADKNPNENDLKVSMPYTGKAVTQNKVTLTTKPTVDTPETKTLLYGTHYTISYKNNLKKGTATMTFTANPASGYTGSFKKTFKIAAQNLSESLFDKTVEIDGNVGNIVHNVSVIEKDAKKNSITLMWEEKSANYSKNGATLSFRLVNAEGIALKQGTDYTVSYSNHKAVTTSDMVQDKYPVMKIKGKGNYAGTLNVRFKIAKTDIGTALDVQTLTVSCTPIARKDNMKFADFKFKLLDGRTVLREGATKDYELVKTACTEEIINAYARSLGTADTTAVIPKVTIKGIGNYTGEKEVSLAEYIYVTKLTSRNIKIEVIGEKVYTGSNVEPEIKVTYYPNNDAGREEAVADSTFTVKDYKITYGSKNMQAGKNKGTVTVTGTGIYGGSVTVKFDIGKKNVYYF
ncbi:MAG: InlB B-repeat-containing protein [Blautia sp.]|nr:InlB B-repeat-containing protein [Lachnoclostridium sp.]MCM1210590.1 InlB B-repeat-containing protein [Blautia sp.]